MWCFYTAVHTNECACANAPKHSWSRISAKGFRVSMSSALVCCYSFHYLQLLCCNPAMRRVPWWLIIRSSYVQLDIVSTLIAPWNKTYNRIHLLALGKMFAVGIGTRFANPFFFTHFCDVHLGRNPSPVCHLCQLLNLADWKCIHRCHTTQEFVSISLSRGWSTAITTQEDRKIPSQVATLRDASSRTRTFLFKNKRRPRF